MASFIVAVLLLCGADLASAPVDALQAASDKAQKTCDIALTRELLPVLKNRLNTATGDDGKAVRTMLAHDALLLANLLRNEYEKPETNTVKKRELGREIDDAASLGFAALGGWPETSEKYRIMADLYMMMMRSKFKGKTFEQPMDEATAKALELNPDNPKALLTKCRRKLFAEEKHGGDFEEGLAMVNRAIELNPEDESAFILRGLAFERQGRIDEAIADYEHALKINPDAWPAKEHLERARKKKP